MWKSYYADIRVCMSRTNTCEHAAICTTNDKNEAFFCNTAHKILTPTSLIVVAMRTKDPIRFIDVVCQQRAKYQVSKRLDQHHKKRMLQSSSYSNRLGTRLFVHKVISYLQPSRGDHNYRVANHQNISVILSQN